MKSESFNSQQLLAIDCPRAYFSEQEVGGQIMAGCSHGEV